MTTQTPQLLYMLEEDLYRLGNSTSPRLHNVRDDDIDVYVRNGIVMVSANGKGISLLTEKRLARRSGWVWKLPANLPMPTGLGLSPDMRDLKPGMAPDHYFLCPVSNMSRWEYIGLLEKLAVRLERSHKL